MYHAGYELISYLCVCFFYFGIRFPFLSAEGLNAEADQPKRGGKRMENESFVIKIKNILKKYKKRRRAVTGP